MEKTNVAQIIEIDRPSEDIREYFAKGCGISRMTYNWGLNKWKEQHEANQLLPKEERKKISGMSLKKEFNAIKEKEFPFVYEVTKYACQQPFLDLDKAFKRFFNNISEYPKFHKKHKTRDSFYIGGDQVKIDGKFLKLPNLKTPIKLKEKLRFDGKINSATISRRADKWFVSIQVEINKPTIKRKYDDGNKRVIGVDLGINKLAVMSDGLVIENSRPLKKALKKLKKEQRKLSRQIEKAKKENRELRESKNFIKQKNKINKIHYAIACQRSDIIHKITNYLTKNFDEIIIEDLNVKGMIKNHNLAQALSDVSFGEFRRQLTYKAEREGCIITLANRYYASSKTCSCCGKKRQQLKLSERTYKCENCFLEIDRDFNASINLENLSVIKKEIKEKKESTRMGAVRSFMPAERASNLTSLSTLKSALATNQFRFPNQE